MQTKLYDDIGNSKEFSSIADAAKFIGVDESSVRKAFTRNSSCKGYKVYINRGVEEAKKSLLEAIEEYKSVTQSDGLHLVLADMHIPYCNEPLMYNIIKLMSNEVFSGLHIIGDFLDLSSLARFDYGKVNKGLTLSEEYDVGNKWLDLLTLYLPENASKTFVFGNHELRWHKYMKSLEAQKFGSALISPRIGLNLDIRKFHIVENYPDGYVEVGDIQLIHGIYLNANHPKTHVQKLRSNCMYGHTHNQLIYRENGVTAYNIGHLADTNTSIFSYSNRFEKMNWTSGFAIIAIKNGISYVTLVEVKDNNFIFNNKFYTNGL
jgi:predicted phosphodiesterase